MQRYLSQLINDILSVLQTIRGDKPKLEKLHDFVMKEIYEEPEEMEKPEEPEIPEKFKKVVAEITDSEENLLCMMNRYDQRSERNFICGAYEKSANHSSF